MTCLWRATTMIHISGAICGLSCGAKRETFCPCCDLLRVKKKNIQNVKCHSIPLSILHYFHYSPVKPMHGFIYWLNQFISELAPSNPKHTPVRSHQLPSLSHLFALHTVLFSLTFILFTSVSDSLSLFTSSLSFLVIPLNHYRGPSLFVGLSHPSLRPRLPSILLLSRSLS